MLIRRFFKTTRPGATFRRLLHLLDLFREAGGAFITPRSLDHQVAEQAAPFLLLRCDVHATTEKNLLAFATALAKHGAKASFHFLATDHPANLGRLPARAQYRTMRKIEAMGHETGLHLDPFFLIHRESRPLEAILQDMLAEYARRDIHPASGSIHGNSRFKGLDHNGFGTSFDVFEELARQPDFPRLADVPEETANLIRQHRTSLQNLGLDNWIDQPPWTERHQRLVINYISDNLLAKKGTFSVTLHPDALCNLKLATGQPPGSLTQVPATRYIPLTGGGLENPPFTGTQDINAKAPEMEELMTMLPAVPCLLLLHPQHYVETTS